MADAWDDDWINKADTKSVATDSTPAPAKLSKAERRAQQAEFNRQIWEDACVMCTLRWKYLLKLYSEKEQNNYFLETQGVVPLKSDFKPTMTVLSRKPPTKVSKSIDGLGQVGLDDDDEDDEAAKNVLTPEEQMQKTQREREEKQKAYEERRRELFGKDSSTSRQSSAKAPSSPRNQSRANRGENRPTSSASQKTRQLYDPNESAKPDAFRPQKKDPHLSENHPVREPRAPDGSGRGGSGFAPRGGRST
ncbi:uncharacterized protein KY384_002094 [Bacidia gigantensis]|uniref:uncharacterized protein n=1 Tax=Bacidia gigantensis TaxID=2732470 RepID=UPI001D047539|nr:uncharacterized protein KY384_002094 [Bacidia gigantensis]KAG8533311.1 hypothetical protein KY384_002094 [Bacidia gigantensis]